MSHQQHEIVFASIPRDVAITLYVLHMQRLDCINYNALYTLDNIDMDNIINMHNDYLETMLADKSH